MTCGDSGHLLRGLRFRRNSWQTFHSAYVTKTRAGGGKEDGVENGGGVGDDCGGGEDDGGGGDDGGGEDDGGAGGDIEGMCQRRC